MLEVGNYVKQASLQFSPRLFRLVKKILEEKNGVGFLNSQALGAKEEELKILCGVVEGKSIVRESHPIAEVRAIRRF